MGWTRVQMATRAARGLAPGDFVNLGIGLPTLIPDLLLEGVRVILHSENEHPRHRPVPGRGHGRSGSDQRRQGNSHLNPGAAFFDSALSVGTGIRGGQSDFKYLSQQLGVAPLLSHSANADRRCDTPPESQPAGTQVTTASGVSLPVCYGTLRVADPIMHR